MKELFIKAHEELITERMEAWEEAHPNATAEEYSRAERRFYDSTADAAYERMTDKYADKIDYARMIRKEAEAEAEKGDVN